MVHDGDYLFIIHIEGEPNAAFTAQVEIEMIGDHGYLSVVDWPLLPFYGLMCGLYVAMGIGWLIVCAMHWRDLLRLALTYYANLVSLIDIFDFQDSILDWSRYLSGNA